MRCVCMCVYIYTVPYDVLISKDNVIPTKKSETNPTREGASISRILQPMCRCDWQIEIIKDYHMEIKLV